MGGSGDRKCVDLHVTSHAGLSHSPGVSRPFPRGPAGTATGAVSSACCCVPTWPFTALFCSIAKCYQLAQLCRVLVASKRLVQYAVASKTAGVACRQSSRSALEGAGCPGKALTTCVSETRPTLKMTPSPVALVTPVFCRFFGIAWCT